MVNIFTIWLWIHFMEHLVYLEESNERTPERYNQLSFSCC